MDEETRLKYIEAELQTWCRRMVEKYTWLTIKYEFSKSYDCLLVSFNGGKDNLAGEEFCKYVLAFEDEMHDKWQDESPLFCDNEDLYELSGSAKTISSN